MTSERPGSQCLTWKSVVFLFYWLQRRRIAIRGAEERAGVSCDSHLQHSFESWRTEKTETLPCFVWRRQENLEPPPAKQPKTSPDVSCLRVAVIRDQNRRLIQLFIRNLASCMDFFFLLTYFNIYSHFLLRFLWIMKTVFFLLKTLRQN